MWGASGSDTKSGRCSGYDEQQAPNSRTPGRLSSVLCPSQTLEKPPVEWAEWLVVGVFEGPGSCQVLPLLCTPPPTYVPEKYMKSLSFEPGFKAKKKGVSWTGKNGSHNHKIEETGLGHNPSFPQLVPSWDYSPPCHLTTTLPSFFPPSLLPSFPLSFFSSPRPHLPSLCAHSFLLVPATSSTVACSSFPHPRNVCEPLDLSASHILFATYTTSAVESPVYSARLNPAVRRVVLGLTATDQKQVPAARHNSPVL